MKLQLLLLGALASATLAHSSHEGPSMPKLLGARQFLSTLKARNAVPEALADHAEERQEPHNTVQALESRQLGGTDGQCGPGVASCATGSCCSPAGWCGVGIDYCAGPDCQLAYGPGCDGNQAPSGASTASVPRPVLGSIQYGGAGIYDCQVAGDIAFTFDDGPYLYTSDLLDKLKVYNAKATFFITGNNLGKGPIDKNYVSLIQRMITEGHQVASHTWSHQNLSSLDATTFQNQMVYNEMAFRNILGYFPTYMRPPYSDCSSTCQNRLKTLGYHVTYFDLDTEGYLNDDPTLIQNSKNIWDTEIKKIVPVTGSYLEIEHDIHYQTVYNLTDYILASMYSKGFKSVTVGTCLGDPSGNWYRSAGGAGSTSSSSTKSSTSTATTKVTSTSSAPTSTSTVVQSVSIDGSCSATITCLGSTFGNCCSQYGYCGSDINYCGTGCQPGSGTCGLSSSSLTSTSLSTLSSVSSIVSSDSSSSTSSTVQTTSSVVPTSSLDSSSFLSSTNTLSSTSYGVLSSSVSSSNILSSTSIVGFTSTQITSSSIAPSSILQTLPSSTTSSYVSNTETSTSKTSSTSSKSSSTSKSSSLSTSTMSSSVSKSSSSLTSSKLLSTSKSSSLSSTTSKSSAVSTTSTVKSSSSTKTSTSSTSTATKPISTDGTCGTKFTCIGSAFGNCCSQYGYCGSTSAYCGTGCNPSGGSCTKVTTTTSSQQTTTLTSTSSAASPTKTKLRTSPDGTCGKASGYTCMGSRYGLCCSAEGKCGNLIFSIFSQPYCGKGCQPAYGICL